MQNIIPILKGHVIQTELRSKKILSFGACFRTVAFVTLRGQFFTNVTTGSVAGGRGRGTARVSYTCHIEKLKVTTFGFSPDISQSK